MSNRSPFTAAQIPAATVLCAALAVGCASAVPPADQPTPKAAEIGPKVGDEAKDFELTAIGGEKVKLSEATEGGPVVLVVLRGYPGYQCPICTKRSPSSAAMATSSRRPARGSCSSTPATG